MAYAQQEWMFDGKVLLYLRQESPYWQCRIKHPRKNQYDVKSTGTTSIEAAKVFANKRFIEVHNLAERNLPITGIHTFGAVYDKFLEANKRYLSDHQLRYAAVISNRYLKPYFGKIRIGAIDNKELDSFWEWRRNYWTIGPGKDDKNKARAALEPKYRTLMQERSLLLQVLRWAHEQGFLPAVPTSKPKKLVAQRLDRGQRPAFDQEDHQKLCTFMESWVYSSMRPNHDGHIYHRTMIRGAILFAFASGCRPNEMWQLKWKDIVLQKDVNGTEFYRLHVPANTKTGWRISIPQPEIKDAIEIIRACP